MDIELHKSRRNLMRYLKLATLFLAAVAFIAISVADSQAGRKGSHRVTPAISAAHGKGSHYNGGH